MNFFEDNDRTFISSLEESVQASGGCFNWVPDRVKYETKFHVLLLDLVFLTLVEAEFLVSNVIFLAS